MTEEKLRAIAKEYGEVKSISLYEGYGMSVRPFYPLPWAFFMLTNFALIQHLSSFLRTRLPSELPQR
jgi:hypothetical protein